MPEHDEGGCIEQVRRIVSYALTNDKVNVIIGIDELQTLLNRIDSLKKQRENLLTFHVFVRGAGYEDGYARAAEQAAQSMGEYEITCKTLTDIVRSTLESFDAKTG